MISHEVLVETTLAKFGIEKPHNLALRFTFDPRATPSLHCLTYLDPKYILHHLSCMISHEVLFETTLAKFGTGKLALSRRASLL